VKCRIWLAIIASGILAAAAPMARPIFAATASAESQSAEPASRSQSRATGHQARGRLVEGMAAYKYLCYLPAGYDAQAKFWPTIIFLHGACSDEDLEKLKRFGPVKFALEQKDFPFVVVAPATAKGWDVRLFDDFLKRIQRQFRVDRNRIYLTGVSMGGHATWRLAMVYPNRFAAIVPVSGAGNPQHAAELLRRLPIWIIHGENDTVVPLELARRMTRALEQVGGNVKSTIYPDRGHDAFIPAYDDPELYEWFLKHSKH